MLTVVAGGTAALVETAEVLTVFAGGTSTTRMIAFDGECALSPSATEPPPLSLVRLLVTGGGTTAAAAPLLLFLLAT